MSEKSGEIHTLAPRLSYVEDQAKWLIDNHGGGGGEPGADPSEKLQKLYLGVLDGAYTDGGSTPWNAETIYESEGISLHQGLYGFDSQGALNCLDGEGFYGHVFAPADVRWNVIATSGAARPLATDIFSGGDFVEALRSKGKSLAEAIFKDPSYIGSFSSETIIGRIEQLQQDVQYLREDLESEVARLDARIDAVWAAM